MMSEPNIEQNGEVQTEAEFELTPQDAQINEQLKAIVEGALFVADGPLTIDKLMGLFPEDARPSRDELRAVLDDLELEYANRGVELRRIDNGYRFQSRDALAPWLQKLWATRPPRYSRALLETLAIIAYRQPITRGEIEEIRGVSVNSEIIKTLLGRDWIRVVGVRDIPGKPELLGTTRGFLEHFSLRGLSELPPLAELRDTEIIAREMNLPLPLEDPDAAEESGNDTGTEDGDVAPALEYAESDAEPEDDAGDELVDEAEETGGEDEDEDGSGRGQSTAAVE